MCVNDNIIKVCENGIEYIQFKKLLEYKDRVTHAFVMKKGQMDTRNNKQATYSKVCDTLNIDKDKVVIVQQKHTDIVQNVDNYVGYIPNCDGSITNKKGIALTSISADCTPILIYDMKNNIIANTHSGWRGTVQKISIKTVDKMINEYGSRPENLICCFAPCIQKCHFEVDRDVKEIFQKNFEYLNNNDIISEGYNGKYYIDTSLINRLLLQEKGVLPENIVDSGLCTVCNSNEMHSYRVEGENYGGNLSIISLKN